MNELDLAMVEILMGPTKTFEQAVVVVKKYFRCPAFVAAEAVETVMERY
jgi:hypothetical protein